MAHEVNGKTTTNLIYAVPVAVFDRCKRTLQTVDGMSKLAEIAISIFTLLDLKSFGISSETLKILSEQADTVKSLKGGAGWATTTYELLTNPFKGGWVKNIKRINGIFLSILGVNKYLDKIKAPNFSHYLFAVGRFSIMQILSTLSSTLGLIENGMNFYENHQNSKKLIHKRIALIKSNDIATPEVKEKLASRVNIINSKIDINEVATCKENMSLLEQEKIFIQNQLNLIEYDEIIGKNVTYNFKSNEDRLQFENSTKWMSEIDVELNKFGLIIKTAKARRKALELAFDLNDVSTAQAKQLNHALKLLENPDALDLKDAKVLLKNKNVFVQFKEVKYAVREINLGIEFKENCWSTASNVFSFAINVFGLGKAHFGANTVMYFLNIQSEDCLKKIEATANLITGGLGIRKLLYGEIPVSEPRPSVILDSHAFAKKKMTLSGLGQNEEVFINLFANQDKKFDVQRESLNIDI